MKKALVAISFGTSYPEAEQAIRNIETKLHAHYPGYDLFSAFTSRMIIRKLKAEENRTVATPPEIMEHLLKNGYQEVLCQSFHIIPGEEYEKTLNDLAPYRSKFKRFVFGKPLLTRESDYRACVELVSRQLPQIQQEDTALVLMGHGSEHFANAAYSQMENTFRHLGFESVYLGTVEGFPSLSYVLERLRKKSVRLVYLMPFLIVAGDHAHNDMAGADSGSWASVLKEHGYHVNIILKGLGEIPEVADLFIAHLKAAQA